MNRHLVLAVAAVVCFAVFTLFGFGLITGTHPDGWFGAGLLLFAGSTV